MSKAEIVLPCDEPSCDKSNLHAMEIYTSMASATAIKRIDGTTYLLTANHFCHNKFDNFQLPEFFKNSYIKDKSKFEFQFSIIYFSYIFFFSGFDFFLFFNFIIFFICNIYRMLFGTSI